MGAIRNAYITLVGKPEGKGPGRRLRSRWENNVRRCLREIGRECVGWMHLAEKRGQ
jgi:hypothetical protein